MTLVLLLGLSFILCKAANTVSGGWGFLPLVSVRITGLELAALRLLNVHR